MSSEKLKESPSRAAATGTGPDAEPLDGALKAQIDKELDQVFADGGLQADPAAAPRAMAEEEPDGDSEAQQILMAEVDALAAAQPPAETAKADPQTVAAGDTAAADAPAQVAESADAPSQAAPRETATVAAVEPAKAEAATSGEPASTLAVKAAEEEQRQEEKEALLETPAAEGGDGKKKRQPESEESAKPAQPSRFAGLLRLPLGWLAAGLNLADRPFQFVGPETRSLLGKVAIATMVLSLLIFIITFLLV